MSVHAKGFDDTQAIPALLDDSLSAETVIRNLAEAHGITATKTNIDKWCDDVSRLAGDDVEFNEVQQLLLNVTKLKIYDGVELIRLHARYLNEMKQQ